MWQSPSPSVVLLNGERLVPRGEGLRARGPGQLRSFRHTHTPPTRPAPHWNPQGWSPLRGKHTIQLRRSKERQEPRCDAFRGRRSEGGRFLGHVSLRADQAGKMILLSWSG